MLFHANKNEKAIRHSKHIPMEKCALLTSASPSKNEAMAVEVHACLLTRVDTTLCVSATAST